MSTCTAPFRCLLDNSVRTYQKEKEEENPWIYDPVYSSALGIQESSGEISAVNLRRMRNDNGYSLDEDGDEIASNTVNYEKYIIIHIYFSVCSNGIMPVFWSSMNLMSYFSFFDSL